MKHDCSHEVGFKTSRFGWRKPWASVISYHVVVNFGCQPLPEVTRNGYHRSTIKDRDLQHKPNISKFGSIFKLSKYQPSGMITIARYHKNGCY